MERTWPAIVVVALAGIAAGILIAGPPSLGDSYVVDTPTPTTTGVTTTVPATVPGTTTTPTAPVTAPVTTTSPDTVAPASTTSAPATTTTAPPTTAAPTTVASGTLDRADVRLVIANGDGRFNLAGINADRLYAAGYVTIDLTDAAKVPATILYYRPGFDDEAAIVAADLLVPNAILEPLPDTPITINDELGDIVVVLGPDAIR